MIQVTDLVRKFTGVIAVDRVSFNVARGDIVGILGPNGAGKTTTLRILSGYLAPTAGRVVIDDMDLSNHSMQIRARIGYLPEHVPLYPEMRVREYLSFRARLKGVTREQLKSRLDKVRELCGLEHVFDRIIGQISRGNRQRVGLADSLIHEPRLLILDEPTVGLDPNQIRAMRETIRGLAGHYTVLLSTHFLTEAEMVCQKVLILHRGRMLAADSPRNLAGAQAGSLNLAIEINAPPEDVTPALRLVSGIRDITAQPCLRAPGRPDGQWHAYNLACENGPDLRPLVFDIVKRRDWVMREMHQTHRNLEEVFTALTGGRPEDRT